MLAITTTFEHTGHWIKMRQSRPVQRTGVITSNPILGELRRHYVRV
jgi:hypothetical protein